MIRRSTFLCTLVAALVLLTHSAPAQIVNLLPLQNGYLVMTCFSGDYMGPNPNGPVVGIVNVSNPPGPVNTNWLAPMYHGEFTAQTWTSSVLGEVFGSCVDANGNIYVTATTVYGKFPFGPGGGGGVYKINGVTGAISTFASLPNAVDPVATTAPGLGNISYDPVNNQFFVTNFEDGKIYRLNSLGAVVSTFDPFTADGGTPGFAPRGERLWGIRAKGNRVYYSVWWEDQGNANAVKANEIWSVGLNGSGDFVPTDNTKEFDVSGFKGFNYSNPVSDIAFSNDGTRMLLAERVMMGNVMPFLGSWAHSARVLEYTGAHLAFVPQPVNKFRIGRFNDSLNACGGVDFGYEALSVQGTDACDSVVWATGDAIHFGPTYIYGLQGMPSSGGSVTNGILIDADMITTGGDKTQIGDVTVFKRCQTQPEDPCKSVRISGKRIVDAAGTPDCCFNIQISNNYQPNYFTSVQAASITPGASFGSTSAPSGWTNTMLTSTLTSWSPSSGSIPIGTRDSLIFCLRLSPGTPLPQQVVVSLIGPNGIVCRDTIDLDCQPPADPPCVAVLRDSVSCKNITANGVQTFSYTFALQNNTIYTMTGANLTPIGGYAIVPNVVTFTPPAGPGQIRGPFTVTIGGPGAQPGSTICFEVTLHDDGYKHCCTDTFCIRLPECPDCCKGFRILQGQQVGIKPSPNGTVALQTTLTAGPMPITAVSATVVSATIKQGCLTQNPKGNVFGVITSAGAIPGLPGPTFSIPPIGPNASREVRWGVNSGGITFNNVPMNLQLSFPPVPTTPKCTDTLDFCIRYRFTDTSCRTCDTLICYRVIRKGKFVIGVPIDHAAGALSGSRVPGAEDASGDPGRSEKRPGAVVLGVDESGNRVDILMSSDTDGKLRVGIAAAEPGSDPGSALKVVRMQVEPMPGVGPLTLRDDAGGSDIRSLDNIATVPVTINQGDVKTFTAKYDNTDKARVFYNDIRLYYTYADAPEDTGVAYFRVTARTPAGMGGDTIIFDPSIAERRKDVRTYALRFGNDNVTADSIASVTVRTKGRVTILAVGPAVDSNSARLMFYDRIPGASAGGLGTVHDWTEVNARVTRVAKGQTVGPIFVTVAGADNDTTVFEYETYDASGDVVSRGEVRIGRPISTSTVPVDGDDATTIMSMGSFPNPATERAVIRFSLATKESGVWLEVRDVTGRVVARLVDGERMEAGHHEVELSTLGMPSGTYYYTLRTAGGSQTRSMTVVR